MATKRQMTVSEVHTTKADAAAEVIGEGFKALVLHNRQLMQAGADKDAMLMQAVAQTLQERSQFWKVQATMLAQFSELIESVQRLKDRAAEREEKRLSAAASREMKEKVYGDIRQLATIGVNQFAKRPMIKESERGLVTELVESFDDDQLVALQQVLRPAQMAAFAKIVDGLKASEDKESGAKESEADDARH